MKITKTLINHKDDRGEIRDILTHQNIDAVTLISCALGAVRANHYHKQSVQYTYVLRGSFEAYAQTGEDATNRTVQIVEAGDLVVHEVGEAHAFKALEPSELLSLTLGPRNGDDYESDTIRLNEPMVRS